MSNSSNNKVSLGVWVVRHKNTREIIRTSDQALALEVLGSHPAYLLSSPCPYCGRADSESFCIRCHGTFGSTL